MSRNHGLLKEEERMAQEPKPDFERYMTALNCQEPDRVPLGEWHVDAMPMESFLGKKIKALQAPMLFSYF